jgi:hypothetical protein
MGLAVIGGAVAVQVTSARSAMFLHHAAASPPTSANTRIAWFCMNPRTSVDTTAILVNRPDSCPMVQFSAPRAALFRWSGPGSSGGNGVALALKADPPGGLLDLHPGEFHASRSLRPLSERMPPLCL